MSASSDYNLEQKMKIDDREYEGDRTAEDYADKSIQGESDGPDDNNHEVEVVDPKFFAGKPHDYYINRNNEDGFHNNFIGNY